MAEYRTRCRCCGRQGHINSRWIPLAKLPVKDKRCSRCGEALEFTPCCTLRSELSLPDL